MRSVIGIVLFMLIFLSCRNKVSLSNLIYQDGNTIYKANEFFEINNDEEIVYDKKSKSLYRVSFSNDTLLLKTDCNETYTILINEGIPRIVYNDCFIWDNRIILKNDESSFFSLFLIDIKSKNIHLIDNEKIKRYKLVCFEDEKIIFYNYDDNGIYSYDIVRKKYEILKNIKTCDFILSPDRFIRIEKNKFEVIDLYNNVINTVSINPRIKETEPLSNNFFYHSDNYLYFAKLDYVFILFHFPAYLITNFIPGKRKLPVKWFRYNLLDETIEEIMLNSKFAKIIAEI